MEQRKGRFLPEEDVVILNCVRKFGPDFKKISQFLNRSHLQIRARYQILSKDRFSIVWSVDDDRKLLQLMTNEKSKINYSNITKYFPGRNRMHLRSRYTTLNKWMKTYPNVDIKHAPRRGARRLNHGFPSNDVTDKKPKVTKRKNKEKLNTDEFNESEFSAEYPDLADQSQKVSDIKLKTYSKKPVQTKISPDTSGNSSFLLPLPEKTQSLKSKVCKRDSLYVRPPPVPNMPAVTIKTHFLKKFKVQSVSDVIDITEKENPSKNVVDEVFNADEEVAEFVAKYLK